ncbi:MAG: hypothetical protein ACRCU9_03065 [Iodobacter sp.]
MDKITVPDQAEALPAVAATAMEAPAAETLQFFTAVFQSEHFLLDQAAAPDIILEENQDRLPGRHIT